MSSKNPRTRLRLLRVATCGAALLVGIALQLDWDHRALAAGPNAIVTVPNAAGGDGCTETDFGRNDDNSSIQTRLPFEVNFFGRTFSSLFVNNNGNVTFDFPLSTFTPFALSTTGVSIIAPFFGDVDTRGAGSGVVTH